MTPNGSKPKTSRKTTGQYLLGFLASTFLAAGCTESSPIPPREETTTQPTPSLPESKPTTTVESTTTESVAEPTMEETIAEIEEFMQTVRITWHGCASIPQDCDVETELAEIYEAEMLDFNIEKLADKTAQGFESRQPLEERHDQFIVEKVEVETPTSDIATVTYCAIDGFIIFDPEAAPDGTDVIIDDTIVVVREQAELRRTDEQGWRMHTRKDLEHFANDEGCEK